VHIGELECLVISSWHACESKPAESFAIEGIRHGLPVFSTDGPADVAVSRTDRTGGRQASFGTFPIAVWQKLPFGDLDPAKFPFAGSC
jgi:hypothetical protein